MANIKPIETVYNGYRFRSRLEARWAVFFDAADIKYEYEPEGFKLPSGGYLPDFYLPELQVYVEIKPFNRDVVKFSGDGNEWELKCEEFRSDVGKAILLCYDDPSHDVFCRLFAWDTTDGGGGESDFDARFLQHEDTIYLVAVDARKDRDIYVTDGFKCNERVVTAWQWFHMDKYRVYRALKSAAIEATMECFEPNASDVLNRAKKAARQARFEHGETPKAERI